MLNQRKKAPKTCSQATSPPFGISCGFEGPSSRSELSQERWDLSLFSSMVEKWGKLFLSAWERWWLRVLRRHVDARLSWSVQDNEGNCRFITPFLSKLGRLLVGGRAFFGRRLLHFHVIQVSFRHRRAISRQWSSNLLSCQLCCADGIMNVGCSSATFSGDKLAQQVELKMR